MKCKKVSFREICNIKNVFKQVNVFRIITIAEIKLIKTLILITSNLYSRENVKKESKNIKNTC